MKNKVIAMYLPQYHPTPDNDEWWGKGFTEWTNVAKAKKLYPGHYQPKVPTELGFYDLRLPQVREAQAQLAKEAGVYGFCYYHYWFGNGKMELELPFKEVVRLKEPDFPFCLCWANETWSRKFWNKDGNVAGKEDLIVQQYLGKEDYIKHFYSLLEAFRDERYIKIDGKLVFMIYRPLDFPGVDDFIKTWNSLAQENGLPGFYFIGSSLDVDNEYNSIIEKGFDGIFSNSTRGINTKNIRWFINMFLRVLFRIPATFDFRKLHKSFIGEYEMKENVFPKLMPNWDHSPRSKNNARIYTHATPEVFQEHVENVLEKIQRKSDEHKVCFLKSWNEWGEGNYMEPDIKYGRGFINSLKNALIKFEV